MNMLRALEIAQFHITGDRPILLCNRFHKFIQDVAMFMDYPTARQLLKSGQLNAAA